MICNKIMRCVAICNEYVNLIEFLNFVTNMVFFFVISSKSRGMMEKRIVKI